MPCLLSIILIASLQLLPIQDHVLPSNYEILICLRHLVEVRKDKEAAIQVFMKSEDISSFSQCQRSVHLSALHSATLIVDCFKISVALGFRVKRWSGNDSTHGLWHAFIVLPVELICTCVWAIHTFHGWRWLHHSQSKYVWEPVSQWLLVRQIINFSRTDNPRYCTVLRYNISYRYCEYTYLLYVGLKSISN